MLDFTNSLDFDTLMQSAIVDLRSKKQFIAQHLQHSCNIEISELESRMHELPESSQILSIIGEESDLIAVVAFLTAKGYSLQFQIIASSFFKIYKEFDWFESGNSNHRLWKPSSAVRIFVEKYAQRLQSNDEPVVNRLKGLDLACGAGRDAVYMAINDWDMIAVDYMSSALARVESLAMNSGLNRNSKCRVQTLQMDLENDLSEKNENNFPPSWLSSFDLLIISRYLHRPLLKHLDSLLKPGGVIVYQTFLEGCEKFGSPKNPRYLLKPGELADTFNTFEIFYDEIEYLTDGRPTNIFIAQKRNLIDIIT